MIVATQIDFIGKRHNAVVDLADIVILSERDISSYPGGITLRVTSFLLSSAVLVALSAPALAAEVSQGPLYGKLSAGAVFVPDIDDGASDSISFSTGWTVGATLGYRLTDWLAVEGEVSYLDASIDSVSSGGTSVDASGDLTSLLGFVNVNLHPMSGNLDPYIGGGIGVAHSEVSLDRISYFPVDASDSSTDLAAQGSVGVNYITNGGTSVGAQYRYIWTDTGGDGVDNITAHSLTLQVTVPF